MNAAQLFNYIQGTEGLIIGQHVGEAAEAEVTSQVNALQASYGKLPGLVGFEIGYGNFGVWTDPAWFGPFSETVAGRLLDLWEDGCILAVTWHIQNPWTKGTCTDLDIGAMADLWTDDNAAYTFYQGMLDRAHDALAWFTSRGVPLLYRPFHEMNGQWHWYEDRDQSDFITLWRDMYARFSDLDILWIYSPNRQYDPLKSVTYYYPGNAYADFAALDHYATLDQWAWVDDSWDDLLTLGKPVALGEFGYGDGGGAVETSYASFVDNVDAHCPEANWAMVWNGDYALVENTGIQAVMDESLGAGEWQIDPGPPAPTELRTFRVSVMPFTLTIEEVA